MRKIISGCLILLLLGSCLTEHKISKNCDKFAKVCGTTENTVYKDTTIYLHDTIEVPLPPDTVKIKGDLIIKDGTVNFRKTCVEGNLVTTCVEVADGKLYVNSYINKKSIQSTVNLTINLKNAIRETNKVEVVKEKYIPSVYKWSFWIVIVQIIGAVLILLNKFKIFNPISLFGKLFKSIF